MKFPPSLGPALGLGLILMAAGCGGGGGGSQAPRPGQGSELPPGFYSGRGPAQERIQATLLGDGSFGLTMASGFQADGGYSLFQGKGHSGAGTFTAALTGHACPGQAAPAAGATFTGRFAPAPDGVMQIQATLKAGPGEVRFTLTRQAHSGEAPGAGRYADALVLFDAPIPSGAAPPRLALDLHASGSVSGTLSWTTLSLPVSGSLRARPDLDAYELDLALIGSNPSLERLFGGAHRTGTAWYDPDLKRLGWVALDQAHPLAFSALGPRPTPGSSGPFDPERDVLPFDPAQVKHWPGLPNLGSTCFVNTSLKMMATLGDLDPFLLDTPGDDPPTARVRTSLRQMLNYIRSGTAGVLPHGRDAHGLVHAVLAAFREHKDTLRYSGVEGRGGNELALTRSVLQVLKVGDLFRLRSVAKTLPPTPGGTPTYRAGTEDGMVVSLDPTLVGFDFGPVQTLAEAIQLIYSRPAVLPELTRQDFPTEVPASLLFQIAYTNPTRPLRFSEEVRIPVHDLDPAKGRETIRREVRMLARAAGVAQSGHVWALIRGDDGWYRNDDAHPSQKVADLAVLDGQADGHGGLRRDSSQIIYERADP